MIKLSVLIPTIESRREVFSNLLIYLNNIKTDEVEIVSLCDNKQMNIGTKRNELLKLAKGEYVCFIDDDDWLPKDYFELVMEGINEGVDCVGFQVNYIVENNPPILCDLSNKWSGWFDDRGGFKYVRCCNHLSPMKWQHAVAIQYKDIRFGEDADFSLRLKASGLLQTEHYIPKVMYEYRFKNEPGKY